MAYDKYSLLLSSPEFKKKKKKPYPLLTKTHLHLVFQDDTRVGGLAYGNLALVLLKCHLQDEALLQLQSFVASFLALLPYNARAREQQHKNHHSDCGTKCLYNTSVMEDQHGKH